MTTRKIRREDKIFVQVTEDNKYMVTNRNGDVLLNSDDDYHIYFKNVNFNNFGALEGRYLGVTDDSLADGYSRDAMYDMKNGWSLRNGNKIRTAKLVTLKNKTGVTIIIQNN